MSDDSPKQTRKQLRSQFGAWVWRSAAARRVVLANLVALLAALWFAADAFTIVLLYWLENLVIGCFNVAKMVLARGGYRSYAEMYLRQPTIIILAIVVPFFLFHYGLFCYGHGSLLFHLFERDVPTGRGLLEDFLLLLIAARAELTLGLVASLVALVIEHALAFYADFWKSGRYARMPFILYFFAPYGRVVLVHLVLLSGALLVDFLYLPTTIVAVLLIIFKTVPELLVVWAGESARTPEPRSIATAGAE